MNTNPKIHDAQIYFKLSAQLKEQAEAAADAEHMTLAAWLRKVMTQAVNATTPASNGN